MRVVFLVIIAALAAAPARAWINAATAAKERTESPYVEVRSPGGAERFPLKSTRAHVSIAGVIADVTVTQEYANEGTEPIEAVYVFPGSTRAAVHALTMTVGGRVRRAKIMERKQAAATYSQAKAEGKSAALLEQQRANVFRMNLANVLPGDRVTIELSYTELLVPRDGVYELVYPTVVGPRYEHASGAASSSGAGFGQWFLPHGQPDPTAFAVDVALAAGLPVAEVSCATHAVQVERPDASRATVTLSPAEAHGGDRDFVLRYRLAGDRIASGLLAHEGTPDGNLEGTFLLTLQPPRRITDAEIPPRDYVFVVDTSGSMSGYPLATARALVSDLLAHLRPVDRFNLMTFSGGQRVLAERSLPATPENVARGLAAIADVEGGGCTELLPALKRALAMPVAPGTSRSFVVVTDGYVTCEAEAFQLVRENLDRANLFAFGIGTAVNRLLIEGLARAGCGEPFVVEGDGEAAEAARLFRDYLQHPLLTGIHVTAEGVDAFDLEPAHQPDLLAARPIVVSGKWRGPRRGKLVVTGLAAGRPWRTELPLADAHAGPDTAALPLLWARERIARLSDLRRQGADAKLADEITALGLSHELLTELTSFVAVDDVVRTAAPATTVSQPLPLPAGVSELATGAVVPTVPEPETWALLVIAALAGVAVALHRPESRA